MAEAEKNTIKKWQAERTGQTHHSPSLRATGTGPDIWVLPTRDSTPPSKSLRGQKTIGVEGSTGR
jgi:hypothetical protein